MIQAGKLVARLAAKNSVSKTFARGLVGTPPRVRISFPEKVAHGVVFAVAIMAVPVYISVNIKNYRGPVEE